MNNVFNILDRELTFSDEKFNYVRLKWEYQRKAYKAEKQLKDIFPKAKDRDSFVGGFLGEFDDLVTDITSNAKKEFGFGRGSKKFGIYNKFIKMREPYINEYIGILDTISENLATELEEQRIYIDKDELFMRIVSDSSLTKRLNEVAELYQLKSSGYSYKYSELIDNVENSINLENNSQRNKLEMVVYENIVLPLSYCLISRMKNGKEIGGCVDTIGYDEKKVQLTEKPIATIGKRIFSDPEIQKAFFQSISDDVFGCFLMKLQLFSENNLCQYEIIEPDEAKRASSLYKLIQSRNINEDDEKNMMAEMLQLDPFQTIYYKVILDKYFDENGEIQRLAKEVTIDLTKHIEDHLTKIYNEGDIGTLESTLELKSEILEAERKFHYKDSKAFKDVLYRQHFLELGRIANDMDRTTVIETWQSIKSGDNQFAGEERSDVNDEDCILILKRRFLQINASEYHDMIRNLGLTDDQTEGDKAYAFYEEGENYNNFEKECTKIISVELKRDEDFANQNYSEDTLASGEVILGYFHYARAMDILGDGKDLLITNKRIYTTKEKFTNFEDISACKPIKKLLVTSLVFEKSDGKTIELPVSKELAVAAADMINRLIFALKNEEYTANSVELSDSKAIAATKSTILGAANSAKKGFSSLFGKKK